MNKKTMSISTVDDLLATTVTMYGFYPSESVVVMAMRGNNLLFCGRLDLSEMDTTPNQLVDAIHTNDVTEIIVLVYTEQDPHATARKVAAFVAPFEVDMLHFLVTDAATAWHAADDGSIYDAQPVDLRSSTPVLSALYEDHTIHQSRDDVVAAMRPAADRSALADEQPDALAELQEQHPTSEARYEFTRDLLARVSALTMAEALQAVAGVHEHIGALIDTMTRDEASQCLPRLIEIRRHALDEAEGDAVAIMAWAAWLSGGGAALTEAHEQLRNVDPDHELVPILDAILTRGIDPKTWRP